MNKEEVKIVIKNLNIEDYKEDLKGSCDVCDSKNRCKDHDKLCFKKRILWNFAKPIYKKRLLKEVNDGSN